MHNQQSFLPWFVLSCVQLFATLRTSLNLNSCSSYNQTLLNLFHFPRIVRDSWVAQLVKNPPTMQETPVWFLGQEVPGRRGRLATPVFLGFPGGSDGKESTCNVGYLGLILGLGRSPGGGHSNPLQYSCLKNPHEQRSLVGYSPWGCKSWTQPSD